MVDQINKLNLREFPEIQTGNPNWITVKLWAENRIQYLREQREVFGMDVRRLDALLGEIKALKELLGLPEAIHKERKRDPIQSASFGIAKLTE